MPTQLTFAVLGCKSYAMVWLNKDGKEVETVKCKGFTLKGVDIDYEIMEQLIRGEKTTATLRLKNQLRRNLARLMIYCVPNSHKTLTFTANNKRMMLDRDRFQTLPYGYKG